MLNPIKLAKRNFLSSLDTNSEEFFHILEVAKNFKNKDLTIKLEDKVLGLIFEFLIFFAEGLQPLLDLFEVEN